MVWYSHLFKNFPQFVVIHTVNDFGGPLLTIRSLQITNVEDVEERELQNTAFGNVNWYSQFIEKNMEIPQKTKNRLP